MNRILTTGSALAICASLFTAGLAVTIAAPALAQDQPVIENAVIDDDDKGEQRERGFWHRMGFKKDRDDDDDDCRGHGRRGGHHGMKRMMHMFGAKGGDLNLTTDRLREIAEGFIALSGNVNLKVGSVSDKDDNTLLVDIVTKDGSAVESFEIDRKTGRPTAIR